MKQRTFIIAVVSLMSLLTQVEYFLGVLAKKQRL